VSVHIKEFIETYRPGGEISNASAKSILSEQGIKYSTYECRDAIIFVVGHSGVRNAYLMFSKFSKRVFSLMEFVCEMETGDLAAETKDDRIAKWLIRLGFVRVFDIEDSSAMKFIRTNHVW
jgi:hypothetical protein